MTTVAVTGCSGYVGNALLSRLASDVAIERVIGVDVIEPRLRPAKLAFQRLDIRDPGLAAAITGADSVVHLAFVLGSRYDEALLREVNLGGLRNVLAAMDSTGIRHLVYPSSAFAYGAHHDNEKPLTEESPLRPNAGSVFAEQKAESEAEITAWRDRTAGTSVAVLRLALVFGPHADTFYSRLLESPVLLAARGYLPVLSVVHEEDAASALHFAVSHGLQGVYNVCADDGVTRADLCEIAGKREVKLSPGLLYALVRHLYAAGVVDLPPGEVAYQMYPWVMSNARLRGEGWAPAYAGRQAVVETARAHADYVSIGVLRATRAQWIRLLLLAAAGALSAAAAARLAVNGVRRVTR